MENIAIDIHGVLDRNPDFFIDEAFRVLDKGGKVHILTGAPWSEQLEQQLLSYSDGLKYWTHFYSLTEHLVEHDLPRYLCAKGRIWSHSNEVWDKIKGWYCYNCRIDRIYDDTIEYRKYMPKDTKFFLYSHDPIEHENKLANGHLTRPPVHKDIKPLLGGNFGN